MIRKSRQTGIELSPENIEGIGGVDLTREGELSTDSSDSELKVRLDSATRTVVTEDQVQVLTNKTIDADLNTISDLELDNLKTGVLNVSTSLTGASDLQVASALAVKTYIDDKAAAQNEASEISYDPTASGLAATNVQDAIDEVEARVDTNASAISSHLSDTTDAHDASAISVVASGTLLATDVQSALVELESEIVAASGSAGTVQTNLTNHINDTVDAHDASAISNTPSGNLAATDIQAAVNELQGDIDTNASNLTSHLNDTTDAHDASAISSVASGNLAATDVQGALNELQSDIDLRALTTGGSIVTPSRLDFKQDTYANLVTYASTASDGQAVYATDTDEYYGIKANALVSFGGGSSGLDTIFQLNATELIATWSTGDNATFLGGGTLAGTFAYNTSTPLHGTSSYKYTQAAGSLNDYIASPAQAVDLRFRGQQTFLSFPFKYDGSTSDIQIVVYDVTNSAIISSSTDVVTGTGTSISTAIVGIIIPLTCASIRVGFHVKVLNSAKILEFDDVQIGTGISDFSSISTTVTEAIEALTGSAVYGSTNTGVPVLNITKNTNLGVIRVDSSAANGTSFVALKDCEIKVSATVTGVSSAGLYHLTRNSSTLTTAGATGILSTGYINNTVGVTAVFSASVKLNAGDILRIQTNAPNIIPSNLTLTATADNNAIASPTQQISSDTLSFNFKATAIDPATDAVGTFNTYTYAASTNTPTIAGTAPTQTTASMNVNGFFLTARGFTTLSTAALPARVDIFIGKGLKSKQVDAYASTAKVGQFNYDYWQGATTLALGTLVYYSEVTGILTIEAASNAVTSVVTRYCGTDFLAATPASGYFVFNASKSPSLLSIPNLKMRIAYLSDIKANNTQGGSAASAAYQTRTLNTIVDNTGIVTSLASNQFTLLPGTYSIEATAPALIVNTHRIRIRNITDSTTPILGKSSHSNATNGSQTDSIASGEITITSSKVFELQHYTQTARATDGLGIGTATGENEVYSQVKIVKIQ